MTQEWDSAKIGTLKGHRASGIHAAHYLKPLGGISRKIVIHSKTLHSSTGTRGSNRKSATLVMRSRDRIISAMKATLSAWSPTTWRMILAKAATMRSAE
ncbi:hypothetical protein CRG98_018450 [Punica granatum]|uniref:Uncharacterized protein n=1 Tax=Punica granatum TaxID=22663 RepID=A0A2I0JZ70_PUNGR|nr:hypothetical protein CRG98_018450 [Punica granatum]